MTGDLVQLPAPRVRFLDLSHVLEVHARVLLRHGGADGVRDEKLLHSALAQPRQTFGGEYLHNSLHAQAAAYVFHISQNQPFNDGNKRTGLVCGVNFLSRNKLFMFQGGDELADAIYAIAGGRANKQTLTEIFQRHALPRRLHPTSKDPF